MTVPTKSTLKRPLVLFISFSALNVLYDRHIDTFNVYKYNQLNIKKKNSIEFARIIENLAIFLYFYPTKKKKTKSK